MKKTNFLLWSIIILLLGFGFWSLYTGKLDDVAGLFINGVWNSLEGMVRSIFHK